MPDRPEKKLPRTLRLNARDNIIVAVDSVDPGTTKDGVTATARTDPSCPCRICTHVPLSRSHTRSVVSSLPDTA